MRKKFISLCVSFFLLLGCQQHYSYEYLMTHPGELHKLYEDCNLSSEKKHCEFITKAAQDFSTLAALQTIHPIQFGMRIMHVQQELVALSNKYNQTVLAKSPNKLVAEAAYAHLTLELVILYQVVALAFLP